MWTWSVSRSSRAPVRRSEPKISAHSSKGKLVVTRMEPRSWRWLKTSKSSAAQVRDQVINDDWPCLSRCLTGKATAGIVDRLHTMVYIGFSSGRCPRPTLLKRDTFQHSHNAAHRRITPPCQNRWPAKDDRKTIRLRPRVGGQRCRRKQLGDSGRVLADWE